MFTNRRGSNEVASDIKDLDRKSKTSSGSQQYTSVLSSSSHGLFSIEDDDDDDDNDEENGEFHCHRILLPLLIVSALMPSIVTLGREHPTLTYRIKVYSSRI